MKDFTTREIRMAKQLARKRLKKDENIAVAVIVILGIILTLVILL